MIDAFVTAAGVQVPAVTAHQMAEVDRVAVEELGPNLHQMMENAGRSLASAAIDMLGDTWRAAPIVVVAGTGGNGGGGICAARHLANRGADVTVVVTDPARLGSVPSDQLDIYRATPGKLAAVDGIDLLRPVLVVDAVIGYSLGGAPHGAAERLIRWARMHTGPVLSLDVPSGVDATTGSAPGVSVAASRTVTLALPKTGLDARAVGDLWLADLGIPAGVYQGMGIEVPIDVFGPGFLVELSVASE